MKKLFLILLGSTSLLALEGANDVVVAQSGCAVLTYGAVPTVAQWQSCFQAKQDLGGASGGTGAITSGQVISALGYTPANKAGDTFTGEVFLPVSTLGNAALNYPQGTPPSSPQNGDIWMTNGGLFYRANGATVGPLTSSITNLSPTTHFFVNGFTAGVPSTAQPSCGDLSNSATSCSTDATNATNIASGTLANARLSATVPLTSANNAWSASQANAHSTLTFSGTVTPNFATANNFSLTLTGNVGLFANPTNIVDGQCGTIRLVQDGTGSRTITSWGADFKFPGGTPPVLTTTAGGVDILNYCTSGTSEVDAAILQAFH